MSDSKYFQTTKKGEIHELKEELNSQGESKKKEAVKKVIAFMTVGKDVSMLFTDVLNCMQTHNLELKKLVYLYVMNYAKSQPDRAILAVNTFQKDASDPNPLIRALAVRTMGCIRVDKITEYLCEPLRNCLRDQDPYVRKTAAVCVAKLYDINPELVESQGFLDILNDLLSDANPMVVANAVAALSEIDEVSKTDVFKINTNNLNKLLAALNECTEWGQVFILNSLAKYSPRDPREAESIAERVTPRLQHANSAVVLSAVKVLVKYMDHMGGTPDTVKTICKKMAPPLVTLLSKEAEIQYVALRNINLIVQKRPEILQYEMKVFFCKYNDPIYVKMEKLEIMIMLASERNIEQVLMEFKEYATEVDVEFVRKSVRAIGRCAIKLEKAAERCIQVLLDLIQTKVNYVVQEAIIVIKDIFRKYPNRYESIIATLCANLESLDEPEAKASMIWIIGEYAERIDNADELLASFLENFKDENTTVQLQLLTAVVKLFLKRPKDTQEMVQTVLNLATQESDNPDLRDRGFIYWRLLSTDPEAAKAVVLAEKPLITDTTSQLDEGLLNDLIPHISTLASVYHKPPESFVTKLKGLSKTRLKVDHDEDEDEYEQEQEDDAAHHASSYQPRDGGHQQSNKGPTQSGNLLDLDLGDLGLGPSNPAPQPQQGLGGLFDFGLQNPGAGMGGMGMGMNVGAPAPAKSMLLPSDQGRGMQIQGNFVRREGRLSMDVTVTNFTGQPMGNFFIGFDKNPFGLAPVAQQIPINVVNPSQSVEALVPLATTGVVGQGTPANAIRIAVRNSLSNDVYFFNATVPLPSLFTEGGALERSAYLSMWKSIPDQNESTRDFILAQALPLDLDYIVRKLTSRNMFEIARRKVNEQDVVYLSVKTENSVYILVELTFKFAIRQCKCSSKTPSVEIIPLFEQSIEQILNGQ